MTIKGLDMVMIARDAAMFARGRYDDTCDRGGGYPARAAAAMRQADAAYARAKAQYPDAAAWMQADSYAMAAHADKAAAGQRAKIRIEAGEDAVIVIADMQRDWEIAAARCVDNS